MAQTVGSDKASLTGRARWGVESGLTNTKVSSEAAKEAKRGLGRTSPPDSGLETSLGTRPAIPPVVSSES